MNMRHLVVVLISLGGISAGILFYSVLNHYEDMRMIDVCDMYARMKFDKGYHYAQRQLNEMFTCFDWNCIERCMNETVNMTCAEEFAEEWNNPSSGYGTEFGGGS